MHTFIQGSERNKADWNETAASIQRRRDELVDAQYISAPRTASERQVFHKCLQRLAKARRKHHPGLNLSRVFFVTLKSDVLLL